MHHTSIQSWYQKASPVLPSNLSFIPIREAPLIRMHPSPFYLQPQKAWQSPIGNIGGAKPPYPIVLSIVAQAKRQILTS